MKNFVSTILASLFLFPFGIAYSQCMMYPVSLAERVNQSEIIVEGKIVSAKSFWNDSHSMIYTASEIEIYKVFKGNKIRGITVITEGGQVGNDMVIVNPGIQLLPGEAGILFIHSSTYDVSNATGTAVNYELYAGAQGFFRYDVVNRTASDPFNTYDNETDLYPLVLRFAGRMSFTEIKPADFFKPEGNNWFMTPPTITSLSPTSTYAGTLGANLFTITGTNFGSSYVAGTSKVEFKNANDGASTFITTPDNHIQSWSSTTITTWIPTGAATGKVKVTNNLGEPVTSSTSITINYNETNVISGGTYYLPDLVDDNGSGGYTLKYNTTFDSNSLAVAAFERALGTWRCATFVNIKHVGTTSIDVNASDGTNLVTFDGASPLAPGVLGTAYSYYTSCSTGVWYLSETDLKFRTDGTGGITWNYGPGSTTSGKTDFESVTLHELGHTHQLGHTVLSPPSVMHWSISTGTDRRTLVATSEVDGGEDVMSRSIISNSCGPSHIIALTAGSCALGAAPLADFSASATTICKNDKINFTDLSSNAPTSWSWSFTGATPSSSTAQNPTGIKYTSTGTFSVTLTATNAIGSDAETKTGYITVNALPTATATAGGPTTFCDGGSVLLSATTGAGLTYKWKKDGTNIGGATSSTYTADATGSYKVVVTNASGCSKTSAAISVTENPAPTATITPDGPTTFCPGDSVKLTAPSGTGLTYQWKKGGSSISGATKKSYIAKTSGTYKVVVTNSFGCSKTSAGTVVTAICKLFADLTTTQFFNLYPNPSANSFTIAFNSDGREDLVLKIFDATGRIVQQTEISNEMTCFTSGEDLLPGIYFIELTQPGYTELVKWIKVK